MQAAVLPSWVASLNLCLTEQSAEMLAARIFTIITLDEKGIASGIQQTPQLIFGFQVNESF